MSDYFLNKIYDSLITQQSKAKSTFKTLSESYDLVYEQEPDVDTQATEQPTAATNEPEQQPNEQYTPSNLPTDFNINQRVYPRRAWTSFQRKLFNDSAKTGTGRGETSVANLISGIDDENILKQMVSGGGESFDVAWPPANMFKDFDKNKKTFKFEVKELEKKDETLRPKTVNPQGKEVYQDPKDTVAIGVEGRGFAVDVLNQVEAGVDVILKQLDDLSADEQKVISEQIAQTVWAAKNKPFAPPATTNSRGKPRTETADYKKELKDYNSYKNWSLKQYLTLIKHAAKSGEVPLTILLGKKWDRSDAEPVPSGFKGEKSSLFIVSLRRLFKLLNDLKHSATPASEVQPETAAPPRVGSLKDFFYKNYKPNETEAPPEVVKDVEDQLDKKAVTVDKELTKLKAKSTGYKFAAKDFYDEVSAAHMLQLLTQIENRIYSNETVLSFFPRDLTGLFAVNGEGYVYMPRNEIPNYVTLDTFSRGGAKIRFK